MYNNKRIAVIIAAAGSGTRMGSGISKQYVKIGGQMIVERAIRCFSFHPFIDDIYIVVKKDEMEFCRKELIEKKKLPKIKAIVSGGRERQESVYHALKLIYGLSEQGIKRSDGRPISPRPRADYVLVHDGARPFVTASAISRLAQAAVEYEAAVLGVPVKDTIKRAGGQWLEDTLDRTGLFSIQTPQGFELRILMEAHKKAREEEFIGTDDSVLVERMGKKVYLVKGEYNNIKITTKEDLQLVPALLQKNEPDRNPMEWRCGNGFDVHAFQEGKQLIIGGVRIPHSHGLSGHSDADVLVHAVIDALLGACGLGDIGLHFPDKDEQYKGISSLKLLNHVKGMVSTAGYQISNIDAIIIGEKPKMAPYTKHMIINMSEVLGIDESQINIKATTTEGLGFSGREEGLAAMATASVYNR